jgi:hypothetical protein
MGSGLKALIVFTCLTLIAGIGYLVYRASQPTIEDAVREVVEQQLDPVSMMKTDLDNLRWAQEAYFLTAKNGCCGYSDDLSQLRTKLDPDAMTGGRLAATPWVPSPGVQITILRAGDKGWSARATHAGSKEVCVIYIGLGYDLPGAKVEGIPYCARPEGR